MMNTGRLFYSNGFWTIYDDENEYHVHPFTIQQINTLIDTQIHYERYAKQINEYAEQYTWQYDAKLNHINAYGKETIVKGTKMTGRKKTNIDYYILKKIIIANHINGLNVNFSIIFETLPSQIHDADIWNERRLEVSPYIDKQSDFNLVPEEFRKNKKKPTKEDLMNYIYVNHYCLSNYKKTNITNVYAKINDLGNLL